MNRANTFSMFEQLSLDVINDNSDLFWIYSCFGLVAESDNPTLLLG